MSKKKQLNQTKEASATAKFTTVKVTVADAVQDTLKTTTVLKQNPAYATHPTMQTSVAAWENAANTLTDIDQKIGAERAALAATEATHEVTIGAWKRSTQSVLAIINALAGGSAKAIQEWGFDVDTRGVAPPETSPPANLRAVFSKKDLTLTLRWKGVKAHRGYLLQIGDTSNPIVWGATIPVAVAHYQPTGLQPGQHVSVRIAVQRKTGVSAFSDVLVVIVR